MTRKKMLGISFILFLFLSYPLSKVAPKDKPNTTVAINSEKTPTSVPTLTATPKPVEKMNIVVTSQIVKKVDGKYRYFFDIRNKDTKPFEGSVTINLYSESQKEYLSGDRFETNKPMDPQLGTSVHFDAHTGPIKIHGKNGISKFSYTVWIGKDKVNEGEGEIVDKYEDLDTGY